MRSVENMGSAIKLLDGGVVKQIRTILTIVLGRSALEDSPEKVEGPWLRAVTKFSSEISPSSLKP
jgi:hypothetical protein